MRLKLEYKYLTGNTVAMLTYCITEMIKTWQPMANLIPPKLEMTNCHVKQQVR